MDCFVAQIERFCKSHNLLPDGGRALVAVSGGADSVALLRVLLKMNVPVVAAHANHGLRGMESDRDQQFVERLCDRLAVPLIVTRLRVREAAAARSISIEMAARELRYAWLERVRRKQKCEVIAVAHHADDQVETVLLNMLRGTGLQGLVGMRPVNGRVVRPLLAVRRADVLRYLDSIKQDFVTDSSNLENKYRRNRIRNVVMPALESQFADATQRLLDSIARITQGTDLYRELVANVISGLTSHCSVEGVPVRRIDTQRLLEYANCPMLLKEILKSEGFGMDLAGEVMTAIKSHSTGASYSSSTLTIKVERDFIECVESSLLERAACEEHEIGSAAFQQKVEVWRKSEPFEATSVNGRDTVAVPAALLDGARRVVLRHWREGDRMRPFGLHGTKLLSDLMVARRFTNAQKRLAWLLEIDGEVVWLVGHRAAQATRVDEGSTDWVLLRSRVRQHYPHQAPQTGLILD